VHQWLFVSIKSAQIPELLGLTAVCECDSRNDHEGHQHLSLLNVGRILMVLYVTVAYMWCSYYCAVSEILGITRL